MNAYERINLTVRLTEHLRSVAVLTIEARKLAPESPDLDDLLDDIARDVREAQALNRQLQDEATS
jgi:hypothetical protein